MELLFFVWTVLGTDLSVTPVGYSSDIPEKWNKVSSVNYWRVSQINTSTMNTTYLKGYTLFAINSQPSEQNERAGRHVTSDLPVSGDEQTVKVA